jgi:hypothetical protein
MENKVNAELVEITEVLKEFAEEINQHGYGLLFMVEHNSKTLEKDIAICSRGVTKGAVINFIAKSIFDSEDVFEEVTKIVGKVILEKEFAKSV